MLGVTINILGMMVTWCPVCISNGVSNNILGEESFTFKTKVNGL
jgi:hypothetical protein